MQYAVMILGRKDEARVETLEAAEEVAKAFATVHPGHVVTVYRQESGKAIRQYKGGEVKRVEVQRVG
jgi:hypothetical protein